MYTIHWYWTVHTVLYSVDIHNLTLINQLAEPA